MDYKTLITAWAQSKLDTLEIPCVEVYAVGLTFNDETGEFSAYVEFDPGRPSDDADDVLAGEWFGEVTLLEFVGEIAKLAP